MSRNVKGSANKLSSWMPGGHCGCPGPNSDHWYGRGCLHHVRSCPEPKGNTLKGAMTCESGQLMIKRVIEITGVIIGEHRKSSGESGSVPRVVGESLRHSERSFGERDIK